MSFRRVLLVVLDSLGVGELPDAHLYGDQGSNTLHNLAEFVGGVDLPNLGRLGLGNIIEVEGVKATETPLGSFGKMNERAAGKDTTTGHWEMTGLVLPEAFPTYPDGFPAEIVDEFTSAIGRGMLGNYAASGTEIIKVLGEEHMNTGKPIVYTSADSVFQIAAHEEVIPIEDLYEMCRTARNILTGEHAVGRVIARPFIGSPGSFERTTRRHDFSLQPIGPTALDLLTRNGITVTGVGKISDIFDGRGVSASHPTTGNDNGMETVTRLLSEVNEGLIFVNFVDFDMLYGHRNDPSGYAEALEAIDVWLPSVLEGLGDDDIMMVTADHGCDPTTKSTDHSREHVPLLVYGKNLKPVDLGVRPTFSDLGMTIIEALCGSDALPLASSELAGDSFLSEVL